MSIRRIQYQITYVHILTFRDEYKIAVNPYFIFDNVEYGVANENTLDEEITLIFRNEHIAFILRKDSITFLYEGDVKDLKDQNGVIRFYWELYDKIKKFNGYNKTVSHQLISNAVIVQDEEKNKSLLSNNEYLAINHFGKLDDFACTYQLSRGNLFTKLQLGGFSRKDIKNYDLSPFRTEYNRDLFTNVGIMGRLELSEPEKSPTFSKFKSLLNKAEEDFGLYNLI